MTKKKNAVSKPVGRPLKEINWSIAENLAAIQCTEEEIAQAFSMNIRTLRIKIKEKYQMNFIQWFEVYSTAGKRSLRRMQYEQAQKGNSTMLVHLGRNWLGQKDKAGDVNIQGTVEHKTGPGFYDQFIIQEDKRRREKQIDGEVINESKTEEITEDSNEDSKGD